MALFLASNVSTTTAGASSGSDDLNNDDNALLLFGALWQGILLFVATIPWWAEKRWSELKEQNQGVHVTNAGKKWVNGQYNFKKRENYWEQSDIDGASKGGITGFLASLQNMFVVHGKDSISGPEGDKFRCEISWCDDKKEWQIKAKKLYWCDDKKEWQIEPTYGDILYRGTESFDINEPEYDIGNVGEPPTEKKHDRPQSVKWEVPEAEGVEEDHAPSVTEFGIAKLLNLLPVLEPHPKGKEVIDNAAVRIYLSFLVMYRNLFCVLTLVSIFCVTPTWGFRPFFIGLPEADETNKDQEFAFIVSITSEMKPPALQTLCSTTILTSLIACLYALKFQRDCHKNQKDTELDKPAGWFAEIPVKDQATLQPHTVTLNVLSKVVEKDLKEAINEKLNKDTGDIHDEVKQKGRNCPLGNCPINCGCCGCQLACTLVFTCCPAGKGWHYAEKRALSSPDQNEQAPLTRSPSGSPGFVSGKPQSKVQEIVVQPVMTQYGEHIKHYKRIKHYQEREKAYAWKEEKSKPKVTFSYCTLSTWFPHLRHNWFARKLRKSRERLQSEREKFESIESEAEKVKLELSGHAFVVFEEDDDLERMLQPPRKWNELRDYSSFEFGRPPFSSVTLQCRHAPHPSDLSWENLHVQSCPNFFYHICHLALLFAVTVVVVSAISVFSNVDEFLEVVESKLEKKCKKGILCAALQWFRSFAEQHVNLIENAPTIILLTFNSLVIPLWIDVISRRRHYWLNSWAEMLQLNLNFITLTLSKMVFPFIAFLIIGMFQLDRCSQKNFEADYCSDFQNWSRDPIRFLGHICVSPINVMGRSGNFYLKYCLNCAFLSNGITLTQLGRHLYRKIGLQCTAVTKSEKKSLNECFVWPWGYWYAWSLTIAANGLIFGIIVPSMLPVTALNFWVKHLVDRELFKEGAFNPGPSSMGIYAPRVVHWMFVLVTCKALAMGTGMIFVRMACRENSNDDSTICYHADSALWWGIVLCVFAVAVTGVSQMSKIEQSLKEGFAPVPDTMISNIGDTVLKWCESAVSTMQEDPLQEPLLTGGPVCPTCQQPAPPPDHPAKRGSKHYSTNLTWDEGGGVEEELTWDAREHALQALMAKEPEDELRNKLCQLLGMRWDEKKSKVVNVLNPQQEREQKVKQNTDKFDRALEEHQGEESMSLQAAMLSLGTATSPLGALRPTISPSLNRSLTHPAPEARRLSQPVHAFHQADFQRVTWNSSQASGPRRQSSPGVFIAVDDEQADARESPRSGSGLSTVSSQPWTPLEVFAHVQEAPAQEVLLQEIPALLHTDFQAEGSAPALHENSSAEVAPVQMTLHEEAQPDAALSEQPAAQDGFVEEALAQDALPEVPAQEALSEQAEPQHAISKEVPAQEEAPAEKAPVEEEASAEDAPAEEEASAEEAPAQEAPAQEEASAKEAPAQGEASAEEAPPQEEASAEEAPAQEEASGKEAPPQEEASGEEAPAQEEASAKEASAQEDTSAEEAPAQQEASAEEGPTQEEASAEEAPAQDASPEDAPAPEAALEEAPGQLLSQQAAAEEAQAEKATAAEGPPEEAHAEEPTVAEAPAEESSQKLLTPALEKQQEASEAAANQGAEADLAPLLPQVAEADLGAGGGTPIQPGTPAQRDPEAARSDTGTPDGLPLYREITSTVQETILQLQTATQESVSSAEPVESGMPVPGEVRVESRFETPPHQGPTVKRSEYVRKEQSAPSDMREPVEVVRQDQSRHSAPPRNYDRDKSGANAVSGSRNTTKQNRISPGSSRSSKGSQHSSPMETLDTVIEEAPLLASSGLETSAPSPDAAVAGTGSSAGNDLQGVNEARSSGTHTPTGSRTSGTPDSRPDSRKSGTPDSKPDSRKGTPGTPSRRKKKGGR